MTSDYMSDNWRKSTRSNGTGSCVETGNAPGSILVRDTTQHGLGPVLTFTAEAWERFTASLR